MQLNQSDVTQIEDFVLAQANRDEIYALAFNNLTSNGSFNSDRWNRVINAIPIAFNYFKHAERLGDQVAFDSAVKYITYFASVKVIAEEATILNQLSDQEYETIKQASEERKNFESVLVDFSQQSNAMNRDNRDNRNLGFNHTQPQVSRSLGMGSQLNGLQEQNNQQGPNNTALNSRIGKMQNGFDSMNVNQAVTSSFGNGNDATATSRYTRASAAPKPEVVKVIEKEYTVMSDFDLEKYPDHFEMSFMRGAKKETESEDIKERVIENLLNEKSSDSNLYKRSTSMKQLDGTENKPVRVQVPISNSLNYTLRHARDINRKEISDLDTTVLEVHSVIHKPIIIDSSKNLMDYLIESPLDDITNAENIEDLFKHILSLRNEGSRQNIAINNLLSKIAQTAVYELVNNAIPEVTYSKDVVADWPEIRKSVLDYLITKTTNDSHFTTNRQSIIDSCTVNLDEYLNDAFESLSNLICCLVTENAIDEDELPVIKTLWGLTDEEAIYQRTTVAILDIPISSSSLGLYVNNREKFKLAKNNAKVFFDAVDGFIKRTAELEYIDIDFTYVTFSEREIYLIERINESEQTYHYVLTLSNDII